MAITHMFSLERSLPTMKLSEYSSSSLKPSYSISLQNWMVASHALYSSEPIVNLMSDPSGRTPSVQSSSAYTSALSVSLASTKFATDLVTRP